MIYNVSESENSQVQNFNRILRLNDKLMYVLKVLEEHKEQEYWVAGGSVCQTIWNYVSGNDIMYGIDDFDIVYYNDTLFDKQEYKLWESLRDECSSLDIWIDAKNQAKAHILQRSRWDKIIPKRTSLFDSVDKYPVVCICIAVRLVENNLQIYAPYGLDDILNGVLRINHTTNDISTFEYKADKWLSKWNTLIKCEV